MILSKWVKNEQKSIGKKLLKIFAVIFTVILLLALTAPYWGSRLVRLYRDNYKEKYRMEFPNNEQTIYLRDVLNGVGLSDQIYYEQNGDWVLYVRPDTSEKAELILDKLPDIINYANSEFDDFQMLIIYCQLDMPSDHFSDSYPCSYSFVTDNNYENGVEMSIDAGCPNEIYEILQNGEFKGVTEFYSEIELSNDILDNFPDLKLYKNPSSQAYAPVFSANFAADCVKNPCRAKARLRIFAYSATKLCSKIRTHFL